ncbi:hypothetical protein [Vibrio rhizosphaerae]
MILAKKKYSITSWQMKLFVLIYLTCLQHSVEEQGMLNKIDRLTIYALMGFISFGALVMRTSASEQASLMPVWGVIAAMIGLWLEIHQYDTSKH